MRRLTGVLLFVGVSLLAGCPADAPSQTAGGRSAAGERGDDTPGDGGSGRTSPAADPEWVRRDAFDFTYRNGEELEINSIVESVGGGVAVFDFDGDGRADVAATGGGTFRDDLGTDGRPTGLFHNRGDWQFADVGEQAGVDSPGRYTHGLSTADFDGDGFPDLLVTGYGGQRLWRNLGDGTFTDATEDAGLDDRQWATSAGWADFDGDGVLDLFLTHYVDWSAENHPVCEGSDGTLDVCSPRSFEGLTDVIYFGDGKGHLYRGEGERGRLTEGGKGLGVVLGDIDLDGDMDAYVGNDSTVNFLYLNDGQGVFREEGLLLGVAVDDRGHPDGSMGVDLGDYNGDGLPDLWVANYEAEAFGLYRNTGGAGFLYATPEAGVNAIGQLFVGFGTVFADFDGDGDEDLAVANGHVVQTERQSPIRQQPLYLRNEGGRFVRGEYRSGYFADAHIGRGLADGDLDGDGDPDLVISHNNDPVAVLENQSPGGEWLALKLIGVVSNRDAVGAIVTLTTDRGQQHRQVTGGGSYLSQPETTVRFARSHGELLRHVDIAWPSGRTQQVSFRDGPILSGSLGMSGRNTVVIVESAGASD